MIRYETGFQLTKAPRQMNIREGKQKEYKNREGDKTEETHKYGEQTEGYWRGVRGLNG